MAKRLQLNEGPNDGERFSAIKYFSIKVSHLFRHNSIEHLIDHIPFSRGSSGPRDRTWVSKRLQYNVNINFIDTGKPKDS